MSTHDAASGAHDAASGAEAQGDDVRSDAAGVVVTLSNLPPMQTTSTTASIEFAMVPVVAGYAVWCRLDAYAPILCPEPFVLGKTSAGPLPLGVHSVDFWARSGNASIDTSHPDASYSWTIVASIDASVPTDSGSVIDAGAGTLQAPMMYVTAAETFAQNASHPEGVWAVQMLGGDQSIGDISESTGVVALSGGDEITGPSTVGTSLMRFGRIVDPTDGAKHAFYFASDASDPATFDHRNRVELTPNDYAPGLTKTGTYWVAFRKYTPAARLGAGDGVMMDVHNSYTPSTVFGPVAVVAATGLWPPNPCVSLNLAWSSEDDPSIAFDGTSSGYNENSWYPYISDSASMGGVSYSAGIPSGGTPYEKYGPTSLAGPVITDPTLPTVNGPADSNPYPADTWVDWVIEYQGDPTGGTGFVRAWLNGVLVVTLSNINIGTPSHPGATTDYVQSGLDSSGGFNTGVWELLSSLYVYEDNNNTEPQIRAALQ